jgi:hypothetical protein
MSSKHAKEIEKKLDILMPKLKQALIDADLGHLKIKSFELTTDPNGPVIKPHNCRPDPDTGIVICP